jgi:hypothetical protein
VVGTPLDHGDVDLCERELGSQHQSGRAAAGDDDVMVGPVRRIGRSRAA